ncbi:MAG: hypothetical protein ACTSRS_05390 [Candidatus Helarchaeota archaeon]
MIKTKIVHTELKGNLSKRFEIIKSMLGIQNDAEVIRFLIQQYYREHLEGRELSARKELEQDKPLINKFMRKYGAEWRRLGED